MFSSQLEDVLLSWSLTIKRPRLMVADGGWWDGEPDGQIFEKKVHGHMPSQKQNFPTKTDCMRGKEVKLCSKLVLKWHRNVKGVSYDTYDDNGDDDGNMTSWGLWGLNCYHEDGVTGEWYDNEWYSEWIEDLERVEWVIGNDDPAHFTHTYTPTSTPILILPGAH